MSQYLPDDLLELMAVKFQMLADPTRLAILRALMEAEKSVGQVVTETGRGQANVSKHLKLLADSGLVCRPRRGCRSIIAWTIPWSSSFAPWSARPFAVKLSAHW